MNLVAAVDKQISSWCDSYLAFVCIQVLVSLFYAQLIISENKYTCMVIHIASLKNEIWKVKYAYKQSIALIQNMKRWARNDGYTHIGWIGGAAAFIALHTVQAADWKN